MAEKSQEIDKQTEPCDCQKQGSEGETKPASNPSQPHSAVGVLSILGTVIKLLPVFAKYLPIVIGIFTGLSKFLENFKPARDAVIDQESLAKLIEEITEREITRIVNENKDKIRVWVPTEEDKQRQEQLDELEERLRKDKERHEKEKAAREEMERLKKEMEEAQG